jgi:solute:Na+ symporter, SSS family
LTLVDWIVLCGSLAFMVIYGIVRGRKNRDLEGFILADRNMRWWTIGLSIMATQASAITFLSTPGQAYTDGMRFVQFYFGLPIAMVVLSVTAVPIFHRLKVYTAYEYLEGRFDLKTRSLAAFLFLIQRGLACGLTIYAPSLIISILLGWNLGITIFVIGVLVISYTATGGTKAVNHTTFLQMLIILVGMGAAFAAVIAMLPSGVGLGDATRIAGKLGRMNAIDTSFDLQNRYNIWSGLIGGFFLAMAYFGTDQSQVGRYLTGKSIAQSRMGLLLNGVVKVPMQFFILFVGATVFAFYQFVPPPVFFNRVETSKIASSEFAGEFRAIEEQHLAAHQIKQRHARAFLDGVPGADAALIASAAEVKEIRGQAIDLIRRNDPNADTNDTNYVFLTFVLTYLPQGLVGLIMAAVLAASMSSTSAELNALASTSIVDIYKRLFRAQGDDRKMVLASKLATLFWGAFAILFAEYASRLGSLVEAVNILGSLFYGTMLGIFLVAFYVKHVGGTATFIAAVIAEIVVLYCFRYTAIPFLWYNVIGCLVLIAAAIAIEPFTRAGNARQT